MQMRGVNLASAEFGTARPGTKGTDYTWPTPAEIDYFVSKGMNTFRIGFMWERLQPTQSGPFATVYAADLDSIVNYATSKGSTVVLNPHNFARYYDKVVGSPEVPNSVFADLWSKLATRYKGNSRVVFGLVNEPHDMPTEQWVSAANAATVAIRATSATNLISVPGNAWTGAGSWNGTWYGTSNAVALKQYVDSGNNYVFEVHNYLDSDGSGAGTECASPTIGTERMSAVVSWARQNGKKVWVGEVAGPNTLTCKSAVTDLLNYLSSNSDVVTGWLWWAAGPWWGEHMLTLEPKAGVDRPQMAWLTPFLLSSPVADGGVDSGKDSGADAGTVNTKPTNPIAFVKGKKMTIVVNGVTSWIHVPESYDSTHNTPTKLFVWLHGCGGQSEWDVDMVSYITDQSWISLAVGGRETTCWSSYATDGSKVLSAIAQLKTNFNIDPRKVFYGGYSSGGDIGYELLFKNAGLFAGGLFENTGPSSTAMSTANTAVWKVNVAHLAHTEDTTYPIADIRTKMNTLKVAGFPVTLIEKPGKHWDNDANSTGTAYDLRTFLLPYLNAGWMAPGPGPTPPPQCVFTYSEWSTCQTNNTQSRSATSTPVGCVGAPMLTQNCTYIPPACSYTYTEWTTCDVNNTQIRAVTNASPVGCSGTPVLTQTCTYVPPPDSDEDGIIDAQDACPTVKGIKTSEPTSNGCAALVVSATKTSDWGTGYCKQFYFKNPNPVAMSWKKMTIFLKDGTLRGAAGVWGATFPNPNAMGTVVVTPLSVTSAKITANSTVQTVGFCANKGVSGYIGTNGGLTY